SVLTQPRHVRAIIVTPFRTLIGARCPGPKPAPVPSVMKLTPTVNEVRASRAVQPTPGIPAQRQMSAPGTVWSSGGPTADAIARCGALTLLQVIHIGLPSAMRKAFNRFVNRADGQTERRAMRAGRDERLVASSLGRTACRARRRPRPS